MSCVEKNESPDRHTPHSRDNEYFPLRWAGSVREFRALLDLQIRHHLGEIGGPDDGARRNYRL